MSPEQTRTRSCGQMVVHEFLAETQPGYRERRLRAEDQTRRSIDSGEAMRVTAKLIRLPVVLHVVYQTDEENIPMPRSRARSTSSTATSGRRTPTGARCRPYGRAS